MNPVWSSLPFYRWETEAQRSKVTHPLSHSSELAELGFEPKYLSNLVFQLQVLLPQLELAALVLGPIGPFPLIAPRRCGLEFPKEFGDELSRGWDLRISREF